MDVYWWFFHGILHDFFHEAVKHIGLTLKKNTMAFWLAFYESITVQ